MVPLAIAAILLLLFGTWLILAALLLLLIRGLLLLCRGGLAGLHSAFAGNEPEDIIRAGDHDVFASHQLSPATVEGNTAADDDALVAQANRKPLNDAPTKHRPIDKAPPLG